MVIILGVLSGKETLTPFPSPTGAGEGRYSLSLLPCLARLLRSSPSPAARWERGSGGEGQRQRRKASKAAKDAEGFVLPLPLHLQARTNAEGIAPVLVGDCFAALAMT